jgi:hypothetical protein
MGGIVGTVARSGEQSRTRPDATGIRQTHRMKSIRYSSNYCSSVGFAPPPGHYGLAARRRRRPLPTRPIPRARVIACHALPRLPHDAARRTLASLRHVPEPRRLARRRLAPEPSCAGRRGGDPSSHALIEREREREREDVSGEGGKEERKQRERKKKEKRKNNRKIGNR